MSKQTPFEMAEEFHDTFDPRKPLKPTAFNEADALHRTGFKAEELVEFLYAAAGNDQKKFQDFVTTLHQSIDLAKEKVLAKNEPVTDSLVGQVDALTDLLYFIYGSFSLMGVNPETIIEIVHQANMGKLFPDGRPHYDPVTNKVMKPANWQTDFAPEAKIAAELQRQIKEAETKN
ncbi:pyrophosphohydrolase domain-containing protein [Enterococcus sp. LJL90]